MHCPFCREQDTKVVDSRLVNDGDAVRRRRSCPSCGERFNTFEYPELSMPKLINETEVERSLMKRNCAVDSLKPWKSGP